MPSADSATSLTWNSSLVSLIKLISRSAETVALMRNLMRLPKFYILKLATIRSSPKFLLS